LWYETLAATHIEDGRVLGCPLAGPPPNVRVAEVTTLKEEHRDDFHKALYWLRDQQIKEGTYKGHFPQGGLERYYNTNTGWALLAFLQAGCNDRHPPEFAETVRRTVEYLTGPAQDAQGAYSGGPGGGGRLNAEHTVPMMALAAAYQSLDDNALRMKARESVLRALQYYNHPDRTADHGGYFYSVPSCHPDANYRGNRVLMSSSLWAYLSIGAARTTFGLPTRLEGIMDHVLEKNAAGGGQMSFRWDPIEGLDTGSVGSRRYMWGWGSAIRLMHGDSPGSDIVWNQIDGFSEHSSGVPRHMAGVMDGYRYYWFPVSRTLRIIGGEEWDEWINSAPEYGWEGMPHHLAEHLVDDGYDDEGYPMAYWPTHSRGSDFLFTGCGSSSWIGREGVTAFTAMFFSDVFEDSWLDEDYVRPADVKCSYGYNQALGQTRATVPADTIMVLDYDNWLVRRGTGDPDQEDCNSRIALRHLGRANALMGDGSVRSLYLEEITPRGRWTLERGH